MVVTVAVFLFNALLFAAIIGGYAYIKPRRIEVLPTALIIHSLYKDYVYPRDQILYLGPVEKSIWSQDLIRTFGIGWPLPLAGKFHNKAYGNFVVISVTQTNEFDRLVINGKTFLVQLSPEQRSEFGKDHEAHHDRAQE